MKFTLLLLPLLMPLALHAQAPRMRDAATHQDLTKTYQKAQQDNPLKKLKETTGPDLSTVKPIPDLMSRSDILCHGGSATLVPKRAILNNPPELAARINNFQQGSKIVGWRDFFQPNRGWITTIEVSRAQAEGKQPIDEKIVENYRKSTSLVVAIYRGSPISVMPLEEEEAKPSKSNSSSAIQTNSKP